MPNLHFITHPEVVIDPNTPVPEWHLSDKGIGRMKALLDKPWVSNIDIVYSSDEQKAKDGAGILSQHLSIDYFIESQLGEIDRSSTGFVGGDAFWEIVKEFYAHPNESVRGWEKAVDAQQRIIKAVEAIIEKHDAQNITIVSHGAVGALYLGYLKNQPISMELEQPGSGGGNYFVLDTLTKQLVENWQSID